MCKITQGKDVRRTYGEDPGEIIGRSIGGNTADDEIPSGAILDIDEQACRHKGVKLDILGV
jgi:hypothetical protein